MVFSMRDRRNDLELGVHRFLQERSKRRGIKSLNVTFDLRGTYSIEVFPIAGTGVTSELLVGWVGECSLDELEIRITAAENAALAGRGVDPTAVLRATYVDN